MLNFSQLLLPAGPVTQSMTVVQMKVTTGTFGDEIAGAGTPLAFDNPVAAGNSVIFASSALDANRNINVHWDGVLMPSIKSRGSGSARWATINAAAEVTNGGNLLIAYGRNNDDTGFLSGTHAWTMWEITPSVQVDQGSYDGPNNPLHHTDASGMSSASEAVVFTSAAFNNPFDGVASADPEMTFTFNNNRMLIGYGEYSSLTANRITVNCNRSDRTAGAVALAVGGSGPPPTTPKRYIGANPIVKRYVGANEVTKRYIGSTQVWPPT